MKIAMMGSTQPSYLSGASRSQQPTRTTTMKDATIAIVRNYSYLCGWLEVQELRQQAELAKLEAARTWRPGLAPLEAYQSKAMTFSLWLYVRTARAPVYASRHCIRELDACKRADLFSAREGCEPVVPPEECIDRHRVKNLITRMLALLPRGDLAGEVLLGERKPAEVAETRRVPVREVYQAVRDAKKRLAGSRRLREYAMEYLG